MFKLEGRRLGRYTLKERLGQGGMGVVFAARAEGASDDVAVKLLFGAFTEDPEFLKRLRGEAQVIASLEHPGIVRLLEYAEEPDIGPYLVMQLVPGRNLRAVLAEGPMPVATATDVAAQVADALAHAHARGVVHRDVKPENLVLGSDGRGVVTDFGIARAAGGTRVTRTGFMPGTPEYMAPEQLGKGEVGPAADLYSLGIVLYEMLTGETPFTSDNVAETIQRQAYQLAPPPSYRRPEVPPELDRLVQALLEKKPEARPASAGAVAAALREHKTLEKPAGPVPLPTVQVAIREHLQPQPSRLRFLPHALFLTALLLLVLAGQEYMKPPPWYEDATGVEPAPLTRVLAGAATLHGAEVAVFAPRRTRSGLDGARAASNALASFLRAGASKDLRARKEDDSWVLESEGGTEILRVEPETAAHLGSSPELAARWFLALTRDHLDLRAGREPEHTLSFERDHPLRPKDARPVGPVFDRVYRRARHQVRQGALSTAAIVEAIESLEKEDREAFREAARLVPREIPKG